VDRKTGPQKTRHDECPGGNAARLTNRSGSLLVRGSSFTSQNYSAWHEGLCMACIASISRARKGFFPDAESRAAARVLVKYSSDFRDILRVVEEDTNERLDLCRTTQGICTIKVGIRRAHGRMITLRKVQCECFHHIHAHVVMIPPILTHVRQSNQIKHTSTNQTAHSQCQA
jgi:hypothetical protein